ncbi:MAG: hypothetical protein GY721_12385, partial [Deltaproteobacteria bacterium]|nr:hypothetical protein [Deltaproteobacteria bacterium]
QPGTLVQEVYEINQLGNSSWRKTLGFSNYQAVLERPMRQHYKKLVLILHPDKAKVNPQYQEAGGYRTIIKAYHYVEWAFETGQGRTEAYRTYLARANKREERAWQEEDDLLRQEAWAWKRKWDEQQFSEEQERIRELARQQQEQRVTTDSDTTWEERSAVFRLKMADEARKEEEEKKRLQQQQDAQREAERSKEEEKADAVPMEVEGGEQPAEAQDIPMMTEEERWHRKLIEEEVDFGGDDEDDEETESFAVVQGGAFEPVDDTEMTLVTEGEVAEYTSRQLLASWMNEEARYPSLLFSVDVLQRARQLREEELLRRMSDVRLLM